MGGTCQSYWDIDVAGERVGEVCMSKELFHVLITVGFMLIKGIQGCERETLTHRSRAQK